MDRSTGTYAALQGTSVNIVGIQLTNSHGRVLMRVHLDKRETAVSLKASLENIAKVLEQRNQIVLSRVRGQIADIASGLPLRSLLNNHVVALNALSREVVVTKWGGRSHAHGSHGLLLGDRGLALLVGPVAANGARSQPFAIHRVQCLVGVGTVPKSDKPISTRASSLHVPHHTRLRDRAKGRESLSQDLVVHFVAQITDKDVEMVGSVLLVGVVRLVSPIDADFLNSSQQ